MKSLTRQSQLLYLALVAGSLLAPALARAGGTPPDAITNLTALVSQTGGTIDLNWTAPGDDGSVGTLNNSTFTIQYTTDTVWAQGSSWSPTDSQPSYVYRIDIATTGVDPGTTQAKQITGLIDNATYYFRAWTKDDNANYSGLSNGATNYVTAVHLGVTVSPGSFAFGQVTRQSTTVGSSSITITNSGNVIQKYSLNLANPAGWTAVSGSPVTDQYRFSAVFSTTTPNSGNFNSSDVVLTTGLSASSTYYAVDGEGGSVKGTTVTAGQNRWLWFKFESPSDNSLGTEQTITITVTAQAN